MFTGKLGPILAGGLMIVAVCQSTFAQSNALRAGGSNSAGTNFNDPFRGRYATYGVETTNSIRVLVAGNCIKSPGYYFVPKRANFGDAIKAAGVKERYKDYHYPGFVINIGREGQSNGRNRMVRFEAMQKAEKEPLQEGDEVQLGHLE
jgi:hypothetical protein